MAELSDSPRRLRTLPRARVEGRFYPLATTPRSRLLGLALMDREYAGPGLLIAGCRSVHTFGMRFPLDVRFLDHRGAVISIRAGVPPWRIVSEPEAASVLEIPAAGG